MHVAAGYFLSKNSSAEDDLYGSFQGSAIGLVESAEGFRSLAACRCCTMTSPNAVGERTWLVIAIKIRSGRSLRSNDQSATKLRAEGNERVDSRRTIRSVIDLDPLLLSSFLGDYDELVGLLQAAAQRIDQKTSGQR
jgi:hypothetical protein